MSDFWKEFLRVQSDKIILALLIVFFFLRHAPEGLILGLLGALTTLINAQRFNLSKPTSDETRKSDTVPVSVGADVKETTRTVPQ